MSMNIARGWKYPQPPPRDIRLNLNSSQARGLLISTNFSAFWNRTGAINTVIQNFTKRTVDGILYGSGGGVTWHYDQLVGPFLRSLGTNDGLHWGDCKQVEGIGQLSVSAWIRRSSAYNEDMIWGKHVGTTNGTFYLAVINGTTIRYTIINSSSSRVDHDVTFTFATNTWHHVVGVYDGTDIKIYINGNHVGTPSAQTGVTKDSASTLAIFDYSGTGWGLAGDIADPRLYDTALSAGDVWNMYDPATRWDLYKPIAPTLWPVGAAATPPDAPTSLTATAASSSQINLAWTDNASDEDGFEIERSPDGSDWSQIDTAAADAESYNDTTCDPNTLYYYRVRAENGAGNSAYTNTASATTPPDDVTLQQYIVWDGDQLRQTDYRYIALADGVPIPDTVAGVAWIYVDEADGDLKVKFGDGTVTVIAADT